MRLAPQWHDNATTANLLVEMDVSFGVEHRELLRSVSAGIADSGALRRVWPRARGAFLRRRLPAVQLGAVGTEDLRLA